MQTRRTASTGWDDDDDDFEPDCVTVVEDCFERGAALRGLWLHVRSPAFRSGRVTAVLCGLTVDLREAALSPEGATIHVQSALSGITVLVPPDWEVACDVDAICGGVGDNRRSPTWAAHRPRLLIRGMIVAGGLSVR